MTTLTLIHIAIDQALQTALVENICRQRVVWALATTQCPHLADISVRELLEDCAAIDALGQAASPSAVERAASAGIAVADLLRLVLRGSGDSMIPACSLLWPELLTGPSSGQWNFGS